MDGLAMQRTLYCGNVWHMMQLQLTTIFLHTKEQPAIRSYLVVIQTFGTVSFESKTMILNFWTTSIDILQAWRTVMSFSICFRSERLQNIEPPYQPNKITFYKNQW